jgi:hypothetical protein
MYLLMFGNEVPFSFARASCSARRWVNLLDLAVAEGQASSEREPPEAKADRAQGHVHRVKMATHTLPLPPRPGECLLCAHSGWDFVGS